MTDRGTSGTSKAYALVSACLVLLTLALALWAPAIHNPDANYYYGVALRISRSKFTASIEPLHAPLVSWLMAPLVWYGISLPCAFRTVNFIAYLALLMGTLRLMSVPACSPLIKTLCLAILGLHLAYISVVLVTPDLIAAAICVWIYAIMAKAGPCISMRQAGGLGVLCALAYYAKALMLPILILSLFTWAIVNRAYGFAPLKHTLRVASLAVFLAILLALPWIGAISLKHHTLMISGQQLIEHGLKRFEYSPVSPVEDYINNAAAPVSGSSAIALFFPKRVMEKVSLSLLTLSAQLQDLFWGEILWIFAAFLGFGVAAALVRPKHSPPLAVLAVLLLVYGAVYMWVWGAHARYYLPIFPILYLLAFYGAETLYSTVIKRRFSPAFAKAALAGAALIYLAAFSYTPRLAAANWSKQDSSIVQDLVRNQALQSQTGIITGNGESWYPAYVSYLLKREFWNALYPALNETPQILRQRLTSWQISQVIWCDKPYANLEAVPGLALAAKVRSGSTTCLIYNFNP